MFCEKIRREKRFTNFYNIDPQESIGNGLGSDFVYGSDDADSRMSMLNEILAGNSNAENWDLKDPEPKRDHSKWLMLRTR